jgi:hypothetical protein
MENSKDEGKAKHKAAKRVLAFGGSTLPTYRNYSISIQWASSATSSNRRSVVIEFCGRSGKTHSKNSTNANQDRMVEVETVKSQKGVQPHFQARLCFPGPDVFPAGDCRQLDIMFAIWRLNESRALFLADA